MIYTIYIRCFFLIQTTLDSACRWIPLPGAPHGTATSTPLLRNRREGPGGPAPARKARVGQYDTLWLFNIAMENDPFIDDFPIKTSIHNGFSMAMLNNQIVW